MITKHSASAVFKDASQSVFFLFSTIPIFKYFSHSLVT